MVTFKASLVALLVVATLCSSSCQALTVVNKGKLSIVVFVPPICLRCKCPPIECFRAPCPQPTCFCPALCKFVPGVEIKAKAKVALTVEKTEFPLSFITIEKGKASFVVSAKALKRIGFYDTIVVTGQSCGKGQCGVAALVFPKSKSYGAEGICLLPGERYGS